MAFSGLYRYFIVVGLWLSSFALVNAQQSIRFAVIGDYGFAGQPELDVSNLVKSWNPDFVITTGDNNYENGAASTIDQNIGQYYHEFISPYTGAYGSGDTVNRFFPSLGNHDWVTTGATPYLNYFTLPGNERYYEFVKGPVHFFVIDSDDHEPDGNSSSSAQALWLQSALSSSSEIWKIVYMHHPPYSSGTAHGSSVVMQWPFKQWGATTVMAGHEHNYERLIENNLVYFVNGLGGKSLYAFGTPIAGSLVRYNSNYGAMLIEANSDSIQFQFITRTGLVIDTYSILASSVIPPAQVNLIDPLNGSSDISIPVTVTWLQASGALNYQIQLSASALFTNLLLDDSTVADTFHTLSGMEFNTTYYLHVRATNNAGWGPFSTTFSFTTWKLPEKVFLEYPADSSVGLSNPIDCRWKAVGDAVAYEFTLSLDSTFASFGQLDSTITDTTYSPIGLDSLLTYFWRVRAKSQAGWGEYSDAWRFKLSTALSVTGIVEKGWNMVSIPLTVSDGRRITLFPNSYYPSWRWIQSYGYVSNDTLIPRRGYWLKFDSTRTVTVTGLPRLSDTIDVTQGWNLVGSLSVPLPADSIRSIPPGIIASKFFEYSHHYQEAATLIPIKGYWVKVKQDGKLVMSSASGSVHPKK